MQWQSTPYTWVLVINGIVALILAGYMWQRRTAAGAIPFIVLMLALAEWTTTSALELSSANMAAKIIWSKFEYVGIVTVPASWFLFAVLYSRRDKWLTRRNLVLLFIEPVILLLLLWTNELHGQVWTKVSLDTSGSFTMLDVTHGLVFWIHAAYSYVLFLAGTYLLFRDVQRATTIYRTRAVVVIAGGFAPFLGNVLTLTGISPWTNLDLTPFCFTLTALATAWALFRYQLLDLTPVAREIVIESMSDALIVLDAQKRIVDLNPAASKLVSTTIRNALGRPVTQLLATRVNLLERLQSANDVHDEITVGEGVNARPYDLRISPIRDNRDRLVGHVMTLRDISDRLKFEAALKNANRVLEERSRQLEVANAKAEEANRLKSQFLSTMSHELRTPFNAIMGFTDLLLTERIGPLNPTQRNFLERTAGNNKRLLALVNDVLDLSRIEAGRMEIVLEPYSPRKMLELAATQSSSLFSQKGLGFELKLEPTLPETVVGDHDRTQQIVVNLLSNASKFTTQGQVELRAGALDALNWQISVRDTGAGIAPHQQELIFEPFRQIDGTSTRQFAGTGLGLSIVRELCTLMKGTVRVESEVGQGSTFVVVLPIGAVEQKPVAEQIRATAAIVPGIG